MNKKGQITIFIIIGILTVIISGLFIYINASKVERTIEQEVEETVKQPTDASEDSITKYVESCIEKEAKPPIKLMAFKGGTLKSIPLNRFYNSIRYRYLCLLNPDLDYCSPIIQTRQEMEQELNS